MKECCNTKKCIFSKLLKLYRFKINVLENIFLPITLLATRIYIGLIFWRSGQTKIGNLDNTKMLFEWEYIPAWEKNNTKQIFGVDINFPVPSPELASTISTYAEISMPVLLIIGLAGRFGALILFGIAATIELFIYPNTTEHYYWLLLLSLLVAMGPGKISIDYFIRKYFNNAHLKIPEHKEYK